jgi:F-type H+-transporting ATPase subunit delta
MYTGLIARRYAIALADFAEQEGQDREVYNEVLRWNALYESEASIREQLTSPILAKEAKQALFRQWMGGEISPSLDRFFLLVLNHQREKFVHFIFKSYERIFKERHGIVDVTLTTASPIAESTAQQIARLACKDDEKADICLHQQVDESLIGGFTCRVDDRLIDASLSRQLALLRQQYQ